MTRIATALALIATSAIAAPAFAENVSTMSTPATVSLDQRDLGQNNTGFVKSTTGAELRVLSSSFYDERDAGKANGDYTTVHVFNSNPASDKSGRR